MKKFTSFLALTVGLGLVLGFAVTTGAYNHSLQNVQYRVAHITWGWWADRTPAPQYSLIDVCLGPSSWTSASTVNGNQITESWQAQRWIDEDDSETGRIVPGAGGAYQHPTYSNAASCLGVYSTSNFAQAGGYWAGPTAYATTAGTGMYYVRVLPTGLYGMFGPSDGAHGDSTNGGDQYLDRLNRRYGETSFRSFPVQWTNTVTTTGVSGFGSAM